MGSVSSTLDNLYAREAQFGTVTLPSGCVENTSVEAAAGISASKCEQHYSKSVTQSGTAVSATHGLHVVLGVAGTLIKILAGNLTACVGASTVTVDVKKNGTTVLSSVITLDSSTGVRGIEVGNLSVTTLAADDVLEVVITANQIGTDTLATGVWAQIHWNEDYAP